MRRRTGALVIALSACLGLTTGVANADPDVAVGGHHFVPGASGAGDPYFPLDGNGGYDVQHYRLEVTYDPATDVLTGKATITARATQDLSSFNLDFEGLTVRSITVESRDATWTRDGGELLDEHGHRPYVTTAGSAPSLGKHLLLAFLPPAQAILGTQLSVSYMEELYPVTVRSADSTSLFDPSNERIRS